MRQVAAAMAILQVIVWFFLFGGPAQAATTGTIAGTVRVQNGNVPVAGAEVTASSPGASYRTLTDAQGRFTIPGADLDTYTITVTAAGFAVFLARGLTVTADETLRVDVQLARTAREIGRTRARSASSAFNTDQLTVRTSVNAEGIDRILGKSFEVSGSKLLAALPGVTVDRNGTPLIRGGFNFQTSFQFEDIDYTEPNASLTNRFQNFGNGNLLNGVGSIEIVPGSGDAVHGNTGTGLIALTAKRGTFPSFGTIDFEFGATQTPAHQFGLEYGWANPSRRISDYASFIANDTSFRYGPAGTDLASIGSDPTSIDPNNQTLWESSGQFGAAAGTGSPTRLYSTAYLNKARQSSRDFINNFVYRFGHENNQSLQFFTQQQATHIDLDAGGAQNLTAVPQTIFWQGNPYVNPTASGSNFDSFSFIFGPPSNADASAFTASHVPTVVAANGVQNGVPLGGPETIDSPFAAYKLQYNWIVNASTSLGLRWTSTRNEQSEFLPAAGIAVPKSGGTRTGAGFDLTKSLAKHQLQAGGSFAFARPYGQRINYIDYTGAYEGLYVNSGSQFVPIGPNGAYTHDLIADFIPQRPAVLNADGGIIGGTPGCVGPGSSIDPSSPPQNCGYLGQFFPNGTPALPPEVEVPKASEQVYALYLQDQIQFSARLRALLGLRLDGYNFLIPDDVQNPPAVDGLRRQRLYEPKLGLSYQLTRNDIVRANFGRSLSIPLPTFIGTDIDRGAFAAFAGIPSYDNATGKPATYCGPGHPYGAYGQTFFVGNLPCANYADQLYWVMRNARFQSQNAITYPLRGATFTNYDISWAHLFKDGSAFRLTPFYRRGYDVVEQTRDLLGIDYISGGQLLSPPVYSNLGTQSAAGIELNVTSRPSDFGLTGQLTATYVNQFGNDATTAYLPTASVELGQVYHSPNLAPFQSTLALSYRSRGGVRVNPVFTYRSGFPYGQGVYTAFTYNGQPVYAPFSNALFPNVFGNVYSTCTVNPQYPGLVTSPNCALSRGAEALTAGPGSLRSAASLLTDLTIEFGGTKRPGLRYGVSITNLFNNSANYPVFNAANDCVVVSTGLCASDQTTGLPNSSATISDTTHGRPTTVGSPYAPYVVYPNLPPQQIRIYVQAAL